MDNNMYAFEGRQNSDECKGHALNTQFLQYSILTLYMHYLSISFFDSHRR